MKRTSITLQALSEPGAWSTSSWPRKLRRGKFIAPATSQSYTQPRLALNGK
jgi:hypothetical protein